MAMQRFVDAMIWGGLALVMVLFLTLCSPPAYACDSWPVEIGTLVRTYEMENGLVFREYDLNSDGTADYATAHGKRNGKETPHPVFYGLGHDDVTDRTDRPFVANRVYVDTKGNGQCQDIQLYFDRNESAKKEKV